MSNSTVFFISCKLMGGLGNQLFQIFTTLAYSIRNNYRCVFPDDYWLNEQRHTYWDSFLESYSKYMIKNAEFENVDLNTFEIYSQNGFNYHSIPVIENNIFLCGYFQSYLFFEDVESELFSTLHISEKQNNIRNKYPQYSFFPNKCTISMHFRIGDYINLQNYHNILSFQYYRNALETMIYKLNNPSELYILYFCEECDNETVLKMIEELMLEFKTIHIYFIKVDDSICDWEQMLLMSICDHHIIANSSFSWWGAYFHSDPNKIVCYPTTWFGYMNSHLNTTDLCPPSWNCISYCY